MIKTHKRLLLIIIPVFQISLATSGFSQGINDTLYGMVYEAGSGVALKEAVVSDAATGEFTTADENGRFAILLSENNTRIKIDLPGYYPNIYVVNKNIETNIYLTKKDFSSDDQLYSSPLDEKLMGNTVGSVSIVSKNDIENSSLSVPDHLLNGKVSGLRVIEHSGMPGHNSWMNIRGISSLYGKNEPLVFVDGMIHETRYPLNYLIDGHMYNPLELVDPDDIVDISVIKTGESGLGSAGSNGVIYINTEQSKETSSEIKFKISGGFSMATKALDVMNADQYKVYFTDMLTSQGYSGDDINSMYPWLNNGPEASDEYYRYNNNTDWQKELFKLSSFQKYHFFVKGGDDIATYNISTGYLRQGSSYENWKYSRYNLRLNGKINITKNFSIVPNTKLSLSDTYLSNMGSDTYTNPVLAALLNPPLAAPYEHSEDGAVLAHFDDVGVFNTSNPSALIENSLGSGRNVHLISSIKAIFNISPKLVITNLTGFDFNNDRESIFIPNIGVVSTGLVKNSPRDMVTELRSMQNYTVISYKYLDDNKHQLNFNGGIRYMSNTYKNNLAEDFNTPSDDFRSLGRGSGYEYLRESLGEVSGLKWISYYGQANYNFLDKYYLTALLTIDGSSVSNKENRYNIYPSVYGAWRINRDYFQNVQWLNNLKLRASWEMTGNMYSEIYRFSDLYYTSRRYLNLSVIVRDYNPNYDLQLEKKSTINTGLDISIMKKSINMKVDYYYSTVNNLVINQQLSYLYGFTDYFDNGGKLTNSGIEFSLNTIKYAGNLTFVFDATAAMQFNNIKKLDFIDENTTFLLTNIYGADYITSVENPVIAFYGYKTLGIYNSDAEANGITGPNGRDMGAGDVIFEDLDHNNRIDDADKQIIGDPSPDLYGGFSLTVSYKMFELSTLFNYSLGNDIYNYVRQQLTSMDSYANQSTDVISKRWEPGKTDATLPELSYGDPEGNNVFSDRWIEDGSYLRLKELRISCNLSKYINLGKEIVLYISGSNLYTFTKYTGYDTETMLINDPFCMGMDLGKIPPLKTFIIGINLDL